MNNVILKPGDNIHEIVGNLPLSGSIATLLPGIYEWDTAVVVPANCQLWGSGEGVTIIKNHGRYAAFQNQMAFGNDNITIGQLSIDCTDNSFMGICLFGSRHTAYRVHVYNHISPLMPDGKERQESFAILLTTSVLNNEWVSSKENVIENCKVSDFHGNYNGGLVIAGRNGSEGVIIHSRYVGSPKPADPFDFIGVIGAPVVEHCIFENVFIGVYTEGGLPTFGGAEMIIRSNIFRNVRGSAMRINLVNPQKELIFENNHVHLTGGVGIEAYANANHLDFLGVRANRFTGVGRLCDIKRIKKLYFQDNLFDKDLSGAIVDCEGNLNRNLSIDGTLCAKDGMLQTDKPGKNQWKVKKVGSWF